MAVAEGSIKGHENGHGRIAARNGKNKMAHYQQEGEDKSLGTMEYTSACRRTLQIARNLPSESFEPKYLEKPMRRCH